MKKHYWVLLLYVVMVLILPQFFNDVQNKKELSFYLSLFIFGHVSVFIYAMYHFKKSFKAGFSEVKKKKKHFFFTVLLGFLCLVLGTILIEPLIDSFSHKSSNQSSLGTVMKSSSIFMLLSFSIVAVVMGPINEEIIFRGIIFNASYKKMGWIAALCISSILFGLIHIHSLSEMLQIVSYAYSGVIFGYIYYKSNFNLIYSASLHVLNNLLGILFLINS